MVPKAVHLTPTACGNGLKVLGESSIQNPATLEARARFSDTQGGEIPHAGPVSSDRHRVVPVRATPTTGASSRSKSSAARSASSMVVLPTRATRSTASESEIK